MSYGIKVKRQAERSWRFLASQGKCAKTTRLRVHALRWEECYRAKEFADFQVHMQSKHGPFENPWQWKVVPL